MPVPASARPKWFRPDAPLLAGWNLPLDNIRDFLGNQRKDNWCWAAVTALASKMLELNGGQGFTQEEVVSMLDPTLADKSNTLWDSWSVLEIEIEQIEGFQLADEMAEIFTLVANGQPVGISINWITDEPSDGHALCAIATGRIGNEPALAVYDPAKGGDRDNIIQLPVNGLFNYYAGDDDGLRGYWSSAVKVA